MNEKLLCEKYGSDFSVIMPGDVSGLSLPCPIFVANKNGWQVEEYKDEDGTIQHSQVIRFFNKGTDDILCMKIEYKSQILNTTAKCSYTEDELSQIKTFIDKCHEILMLHNLGVIDLTQLIAAINVKLNPEKQLAKYRIFAETHYDCYFHLLYVDMPDISFNEACKKYKEIKTDPKIYRNEQIPGYYYLRELEIEKPSITIPHINGKLKEVNESLMKVEKALQNNTDVDKAKNCLVKKNDELQALWRKFSSQSFIRKDENFDEENDIAAAGKNNELKNQGYEIIKQCYDLLDENLALENREETSKQFWQTKELIEDILRYKIYAFQDLYNQNEWRLIGFADTLKEAYFYLENDRTSYDKSNDSEYVRDRGYKSVVHHMFVDPEDECTQLYFKIEGENFIEYFDATAEGPLLKFANYTKAEGICYFCKTKFEGHGKTCIPVEYRWETRFGYKRCCPDCEEKILKQAEMDKEFRERIRRKFLFVRPEYDVKTSDQVLLKDFLKKMRI